MFYLESNRLGFRGERGPSLVALSEIDRNLLQRCLGQKPGAWNDFVDRFLGLVIHVISHSAQCRSIRLTADDRDDLASEVFLALVEDDFATLRRFRGGCSLATYLTVVARRVVVRELSRRNVRTPLDQVANIADGSVDIAKMLGDHEQVERLLLELDGGEAAIVRMYHLEGKSYQEISSAVGMPENSVGPTLSRARTKMRAAAGNEV